jgi:farnesol dehydrogenase
MKYFITGTTGFIGFHLARRLTKEGHTVHALYRDEAKTGDLRQLDQVHLFRGDLFDTEGLQRAMKGCDGIFHLAGHAKSWDKDHKNFHRINVTGTSNICEAAISTDVKRMVFTSTAGVINPSGERPSDENTMRSVSYFTEYDRTKAEAERLLGQYTANNLEIVTVNPSRVYGPGLLSEGNSTTKAIEFFILGKLRFLPGNGNSIGNYVYIDDVIEGHLLAMQKGKPGERYILGGENLSYQAFFGMIAHLSGKKKRMYPVPLSLIKLSARLMEIRANLTGTPPLITPPWVKKYSHNWQLSSQKAISELGYRITPIEQGLGRTVDWILEKNGHK